uniref:Transporter n=1 Tax=Ascaris suum TaxID=6253 RepID=F1KWA8_ASCSU
MGSTGTDASSLEHSEIKPFRLLGSTRLGVSLTGFFGCALVYALRSNASFAIVCMVNGTAIELLTETTNETKGTSCTILGTPSNDTKDAIEGELMWSKQMQGSVLSAFFWGYLFTQVLGGYLSALVGGKIVIGTAVLASAVLTLMSPVAATTHVYIFIAIRAALGVVQGTVFPAYHTLFSLWAPPMERSFLVGLTLAGAQIGNVLVMPLSGLLCRYGFGGGWPSIYYVLGIAGVVWSVVWFYYVTDSPTKNRRIDPDERTYIEASLADVIVDPSKKKRRIPWRPILTSLPVWAVYCGQFAGDWGAYMMMTTLPLFMNDVLGFDLTSLGFLSAIPYIAYFVVIIVGGMVADKVLDAHLLSTIAVRRLAMLIALVSQTVFLIASGYCGCGQEMLVVVFLTLSIGLSGLQFSGYVVNYLDIAPTFAGPVIGIGNTLSCIGGILCPLMVGAFTPTGSKEEWQLVFWVTGVILVAGALLFTFFAKGEVQPWALAEPDGAEEQKPTQSTENISQKPIAEASYSATPSEQASSSRAAVERMKASRG